jgi:Arc/MetJ family transcription regulator
MRWAYSMRTTIDINSRLMRQAMRLSGIDTKKAAVETALRLLIEVHGLNEHPPAERKRMLGMGRSR